jgi:2-polyprenyl-3-methyl-5-hydroxy-6-metoxy-1,4-benzoquinol methylase
MSNLQSLSALYICLGLLGLGLIVWVGWALLGRRHAMPCPAWLAWVLERPFGEARRTQAALDRLHLQPGMHVLDAGCGPGRLTIPIARAIGPVGRVTALDIQEGMLDRARARAAAASVTNIEFVRAALGARTLGPAHFDRAILVTVLGEIPDREAALREIFDSLKPGGFLSVSELMLDPHYQSRATVLRLAGPLGFRESEFFGNVFDFTLNLEKPNQPV